jgi:hypothetical protein
MMIVWAIVTLVCLGYFLSEAMRAPIIEDVQPDDDGDAPADQSDARHYEHPVASHHKLPPRTPGQ